jgi:tetraprenyl-beta-curcumene synthase
LWLASAPSQDCLTSRYPGSPKASHDIASDPAPLTADQLWALVRAATRELLWGLRTVSKEMHAWRTRALEIPDQALRSDALHALENKRTHADGAALFWTLPRRRNMHLLRLLVAYELIWDLLDNLSERAAAAGHIDGYHLHLAIVEAIDPDRPISDYYRRHPGSDDGGYLRALVETCREACTALPSYPRVRALAIREAHRAQVLGINHDTDPVRQEQALKDWVEHELPGNHDAQWFELSGAASAPLAIHALLALAAEPVCSQSDIARIHAAYFPWLCAATTMLDSYVDQAEDTKNGDHSYIAHYPDKNSAARGVQDLVRQATLEARSLPGGPKHAVIAAAMTAMYLSKSSAYAPSLAATTQVLIDAGGSLTRLLLPVLRVWRAAYSQRSA